MKSTTGEKIFAAVISLFVLGVGVLFDLNALVIKRVCDIDKQYLYCSFHVNPSAWNWIGLVLSNLAFIFISGAWALVIGGQTTKKPGLVTFIALVVGVLGFALCKA